MRETEKARTALTGELGEPRCRVEGPDKSEAEPQRGEGALGLAHAELEQIFETAADGMRVIDRNFQVLRVNGAFSTLSGMSRDEALGRKCFDVLPGRFCHTPDCPLIRILGGEQRVEYDAEKERADGVRVPCIVTATPFRGPGGELIGIIEDLKDITERKRAEEALQEAKEAAETANRELEATNRRLEQAVEQVNRRADGCGKKPARAPGSTQGEERSDDVMDLEEAKARVDGDADLLNELIFLFLREVPRLTERIREAASRADAEAVKHLGHYVKGSARNLSARAMADVALKLEMMGRGGDLAGAEAALQELESEMARLRTHLSHLKLDGRL